MRLLRGFTIIAELRFKLSRSPKALEALAFQQLEAALAGGESWSVKYILDRVWAPSRGIPLGDLSTDAVRQALQAGELSIAEAAQIADVLSKLASVDAVADLEQRLAQMETLLMGGPQTLRIDGGDQ
jgi:hypothetical protein